MAIMLVIILMSTSTGLTANYVRAKSKNQMSSVYIGEGYEVTFKVTSQWTGAFNADVSIRNTSDKIIDNWALGFDMPYGITN